MGDEDEYDRESDQLEPEDTLEFTGVPDVLDEGFTVPERPWDKDEFGVTPREERTGEDLDHRLARELPDVGADGGGGDEDWPADAEDTDGELLDDEVGNGRAGRLVAADEGGVSDTDPDEWARDVGVDGAGASAEEAAVHVVDED